MPPRGQINAGWSKSALTERGLHNDIPLIVLLCVLLVFYSMDLSANTRTLTYLSIKSK